MSNYIDNESLTTLGQGGDIFVESKTNLWPGRRCGISRGREWVDGAGLLHSVGRIFIIYDQIFLKWKCNKESDRNYSLMVI